MRKIIDGVAIQRVDLYVIRVNNSISRTLHSPRHIELRIRNKLIDLFVQITYPGQVPPVDCQVLIRSLSFSVRAVSK
jgi:hypothetical protein